MKSAVFIGNALIKEETKRDVGVQLSAIAS